LTSMIKVNNYERERERERRKQIFLFFLVAAG
jgi:hypothetical protein